MKGRTPSIRGTFLAMSMLTLGTIAAGCGSTVGPSVGTGELTDPVADKVVPSSSGRGRIEHVVVIVQENRSFDNVFLGYPGADTATSGVRSDGTRVPLQPISFAEGYDISHNLSDYVKAYNDGAMNGFDRESVGGIGGSTPLPPGVAAPANAPYAYLEQSETAPYFTLASSYVLADRFFPSQIDASFTAHQFLIAAQSGGTVDTPNNQPWGCDAQAGTTVATITSARTTGPGLFPCFSYLTLGDELDRANLPWRYYAPKIGGDTGQVWSAYDAISQIRFGGDWTRSVISPETRVLDDIASGPLPAVTWVVPDFANSDHPQSNSSSGPQWVTSIVNAVGASPDWRSTAIIVFWDDWGGWYDHVRPPQLGVQSLGIRTPMLVISPYAKHDYVSHMQFETGSIDRFIEGIFGLDTLGDADFRARDLGDCFDFAAAPRSYRPFAVRRSPQSFREQQPSSRPPDSD